MIDFGWVLGIAPGGAVSMEASVPFKLTSEMVEVMGGIQSDLFAEFVLLFVSGFLALQAQSHKIVTLVEIMAEQSGFPWCVRARPPSPRVPPPHLASSGARPSIRMHLTETTMLSAAVFTVGTRPRS